MIMSEFEMPEFVCVFCDREVSSGDKACYFCNEYKGIMTLAEWEDYTGEVWEE